MRHDAPHSCSEPGSRRRRASHRWVAQQLPVTCAMQSESPASTMAKKVNCTLAEAERCSHHAQALTRRVRLRARPPPLLLSPFRRLCSRDQAPCSVFKREASWHPRLRGSGDECSYLAMHAGSLDEAIAEWEADEAWERQVSTHALGDQRTDALSCPRAATPGPIGLEHSGIHYTQTGSMNAHTHGLDAVFASPTSAMAHVDTAGCRTWRQCSPPLPRCRR